MSTFRSPGFRCLLVTLVTMANAETSAAVAQQGCLPPSATARVGLMRLIHPGGVAALHFSANGKRLISVGEDDVVRTWDLVSGTEAHSWDAGHFRAVGFAPDGSSLATLSGTGTLTHWTSNGRRRAMFKVGPKQSLGSLSLNLDGDRLVAANRDGRISTWDLGTGKRLQAFDLKPARPGKLRLSADGSRAVTEGKEHVLCVWDLAGARKVLELPGHGSAAETMVFSPDLRYLASQEQSPEIHVWDLATGKRIASLEDSNPLFAFSPDGRTLASGGSGVEQVRLWDLPTAKERARFTHPHGIESLAFSPDGRYLATGAGGKGVIRIWEIKPDEEPLPLAGIEDGTPLAFLNGGRTLAVRTGDNLCYWDLVEPQGAGAWQARRRPRRGEALPHLLALAADGKVAVSWKPGCTVVVLDVATGAELRTLGDGTPCAGAAFAPDGKAVAGNINGDIKVWDAGSGKELRLVKAAGNLTGRPGAFALAGKVLLVQGERVQCWEVPLPRAMLDLIRARASAFSPDGQVMASAARDLNDPGIQLWEVATGKVFATLPGHEAPVKSLLFSPDGRALASGAGDGTMLLWDTRLQSQGSTGAARRGEDLERCWQALAAADAVAAHAAMASLSRQPTASLALLRQRLQPIAALSAERIEALIARLDADPFEAREEAYQALRTLGKAAEPRLRQALAKKPGLDLRLALERLVEELGPVVGVPGETLRGVRAVRVLEALGTPEARAHLEQLAQGAEAATLTGAAKAALQRLTAPAPKTPEPAAKPPVPRPVLPKPLSCWDTLGKANAAVAYKATWALIAQPEQALNLIKERLKAGVEDDPQALPVPEGEPLRAVRAVEVLERIGTPAARQFLDVLSKGPAARTTREAKAALARINRFAGAAADPAKEAEDLWEKYWEDLADASAPAGHQAIWALIADPERTVAHFKERLKPTPAEAPDKLPLLAAAPGEVLRVVRAIEVLERIGTPVARAILQRLDDGRPSRSAREARAALERMDQQAAVPATEAPKVPPAKQTFDDYGDPLPANAMARIGTTRLRHADPVRRLVFSPDGKQLFSTGADKMVRIWDTATGREINSWSLGELYGEDIAPDGQTVAAIDPKGGVTLVSMTGREHARLLADGRDAHHLGFYADSKRLFIYHGETISYWDVDGPKKLNAMEAKGPYWSSKLGSGNCVSTTLGIGESQLWDLTLGKKVGRLVYDPQTFGLLLFRLSPDGRYAVGMNDDRCTLFELATTQMVFAHLCDAGSFAFAPDGRTFASATESSANLRLLDLATGHTTRLLDRSGLSGHRRLAFSRDSRLLATGSDTGVIRIWDVRSGTETVPLPGREVGLPIALRNAGRTLVAEKDGGLRSWDLEKRDRAQGSWFVRERYQPANPMEDGKPIQDANSNHESALSPSGTVVGISMGGDLQLREPSSNWPVFTLPGVGAFEFSPDGRFLASGGRERDPTIRLWEVATGKAFAELHGHQGRVERLLFTPDGRTLITGGADGTILLWDIRPQRLAAPSDKPNAAALARGWAALAEADAVAAHQAMGLFLRHPAVSLPFLREKFPPVSLPSAQRIEALIVQLDADAFAEREAAYQELRSLHTVVEAQLRLALGKKPNLNVQRQLERLLEDLEIKDLGIPPGDRLRALRAVRVLEAMSGPDARRHLEQLAKGAAKAPATEAAKAALKRLNGTESRTGGSQ